MFKNASNTSTAPNPDFSRLSGKIEKIFCIEHIDSAKPRFFKAFREKGAVENWFRSSRRCEKDRQIKFSSKE